MGIPSPDPGPTGSIHPRCSSANRGSVAWTAIARLSSCSARKRAVTSVIGMARAPQPEAALARCASRESGTGQDVKRRRSVQRSSSACSDSRASSVRVPEERLIRARRFSSSRDGIRSTAAVRPSACAATKPWWIAAPQLSARLRPGGVADLQLAATVGVQLDRGVVDHAPAPGLAVVHARGTTGQLDDAESEGSGGCAHGCLLGWSEPRPAKQWTAGA